MTKKIWVQFNDMESYRENEMRLCTLLSKAPGECMAFVYIRDIKNIREMHTYSFDEKQIELLNDAFGEENVRYQEGETKKKTEKKIEWNRPTETPKIKQIIPCPHDMYAVVKDADSSECKYKVLLYALCSDGEVYPSGIRRIIDLADVQPCPIAARFYDRYRARIADIRTVAQRNGILSDMQQYFEREVRQEPQNRDKLSEAYQMLKRECWEVGLCGNG